MPRLVGRKKAFYLVHQAYDKILEVRFLRGFGVFLARGQNVPKQALNAFLNNFILAASGHLPG